jgi:outer membrane protein assembly factor BamB
VLGTIFSWRHESRRASTFVVIPEHALDGSNDRLSRFCNRDILVRLTPLRVRRCLLLAGLMLMFSAYCVPLPAQSEPKPAAGELAKGAENVEPVAPAQKAGEVPGAEKPADAAKRDDDEPAPDDRPAAVEDGVDDLEEVKPKRTPLGRVLGRLFFGRDEIDAQPRNGKKRLRTDPRAPFDTKLSGLLRKAQNHLRAKETRQCADVLQHLLELPEDALYEATPGKLISVRTAAQRMLAKLPKEEQDRYRLLVGEQAQRELQAAHAAGSSVALAQVATKYLQTEAGYQAADQLATKYVDRAEFGLAAHWLEELWQAEAPCTKLPGWRMKAEFVAKKAPTTRLAKLLANRKETLPAKVSIGGQTVNSGVWLASQLGNAGLATPTLDDWLQFFGTAKRVGQAAAGEPLLLKRWSIPLTGNPAIQNLMDKLIDDLRDQRQSPILTFDPLLVDGKVVFRTLRGVMVADAATGKVLWTTPDELSADDLLAAVASADSGSSHRVRPNPRFAPGFLDNFDPFLGDLQDTSASDNPLTHLLFRNANHGLLSSDGRRLFVVEDQSVLTNLQPGRYLGEDVPDIDALGRALGVNRLTAYDLQSGRSLWEIGGRDLHDPFSLPLAGTFIFGPPVVEGGELFLVNEAEGEIRLQVLDPTTGTPRWSQLIAHAQAKINSDFGRQWFTSQVAIADGIVVCPTTIGWLVGVDRTTRNILWAHRYQDYREDEPTEAQEAAVQPAQLNERWAAAPPVVVGNRVIFTPPESQVITCLNLNDGELLWEKPRNDETLFLAGVFGNQAVLVGSTSIRALDIENKGRTLWTIKYGAKEVRPAGRGVAVQERYYLPLTSGELLCINLSTTNKQERVLARLKLPATAVSQLPQFGNLAMYRGMLLSLGLKGMVAFEPKLSIEDELRRQLAADPQAASATIRKAELELLNNHHRAALDLLHQLQGATLTGELRERYRSASSTALAFLLREDLKSGDAEFEELSRLAELPAEQQAREMLRSERLLARQEHIAAFEVYLSFAQTFGSTTVVPGIPSALQVRGDRWASGRLEQLWRTLSAETAAVLDQRVRDLSQAAVVADVDSQYRFLTLFGFHSAAHPVRKRLVEALCQTESWQAAENVLWDLELDPAERPWATERMARLWRHAGMLADANKAYNVWERDFPTVPLDGGPTPSQAIKELRDAGQLPLADNKPLVNWRSRDLELSRFGSSYDIGANPRLFSFQGAGLPFYQRHRIQYAHQESRFEVVDVTTEKRVWSVPVRSSPDAAPVGGIMGRVRGHQVYLFGGGFVTALSTMDRRVAWTQPQFGRPIKDDEQHLLTDNLDNIPFNRSQRYADPLLPIVDGTGASGALVEHWSIFLRNGLSQLLANQPQLIVNQRYVSYLMRRQLVVMDAVTGEVVWTRQDLPAAALVRGGPRVIYVLDYFGESVTAYSALDGSKLDIPKLNNLCKYAVDLIDDDLIRVEPAPIFNLGAQPVQARLQRFDPLTQSVIWRASFSPETKAACLSGHRLVILNGDGQLQLCNLKTGSLTPSGMLTPKELRSDTEVRVIPTYDQLLVIANRSRQFPKDPPPESFPSIQVHGMVYAFDLTSGKEQWKQRIEGLHLILECLDHSPVALFVSRTFQQNQIANWRISLKAIDRFGGKIVHDSSWLSQLPLQVLTVNVPGEFLEFRTYSDRIRLTPKPD